MSHQVIAYKTNRLVGDAYATITTRRRRRLCIRSTHRTPNKNIDKAYFLKTSDTIDQIYSNRWEILELMATFVHIYYRGKIVEIEES